MLTPIFHVDAFATRRFAGNPAAVMPLDHFPPDATLQAIAAENNLSETAFLVREGAGYRLRWLPCWANRLHKTAFCASQASRRGGEVMCRLVHDRVDAPIVELTTCDCSLCVKKNAVMAKVPQEGLTVEVGAEMLTLHQWNTHRAKHYFCRQCGIYVFHRKRSAPDQFGVNVFCLENFDVASLPIRRTAGASMSVEDRTGRPEWPGPRN